MKKRPLLTFLKKVFGNPIVRGTLKSLPIGNWIYEVAENIKHSKDPNNAITPLPHSPLSLLAQAVFLGLIVYAFLTHQISAEDLMRYVTPEDFKNFGESLAPVDSL